jgi:hypothetical protein
MLVIMCTKVGVVPDPLFFHDPAKLMRAQESCRDDALQIQAYAVVKFGRCYAMKYVLSHRGNAQ